MWGKLFGRDKPEPPKPVAAKPNGYFSSTQIVVPELGREDYLAVLQERSFQQPLPKPTVTAGVGMDNVGDSGWSGDNSAPGNKAFFNFGGGNIPDTQIAWYFSQGFIGYWLCAVIAQNGLVDKCCTIPAEDAVRDWFEIAVDDGAEVEPEKLAQLGKLDAKFGLKKQLEQFERFGRVFGVRHCLFKVKSTDPKYYENPFNSDAVTKGSYQGMVQIDPNWLAPLFTDEAIRDPAAIDYYEPTWWTVNGQKIHKSHFVIMRHADVVDTLKPSYQYGGVGIPQKIFSRVYCAERTADEAPQLALTKRTTVIHTDMEAALANQSAFESKMAQFAQWRDNYAVQALGTAETMEQHDTNLTDLDVTIMTQYQLVAMLANVPATKLMGTQPKGFNATGEYEMATYRESLETIRSHHLTPLVARHHLLCILSEIEPGAKWTVSPVWNPLDSPTEKERAEINKTEAETDALLMDAGMVDSDEGRKRLVANPARGYSNIGSEDGDQPGDDEDGTGGIGRPTNKTLQQISLNGPQILALQGILTAIPSGELTPEAAKALIATSFPLDEDSISKLVDSMKDAEPPAPPPAPVIAGAPGAPGTPKPPGNADEPGNGQEPPANA